MGMARLEWTEALDARLRRLRAEGAGWPEIASALAVSADVARERGRRIGARPPTASPEPWADDKRRPPLPSGDPRAWGLLTRGTCLAGMPWPDRTHECAADGKGSDHYGT
jgi:hypothetical protein